MADDVEVVSTVEWGAAPPERRSWVDRLTAVDAPTPRARFRPNYLALGLAVVGFLVLAGAQYLPWMNVDGNVLRTTDNNVGRVGMHLSSLPAGGTIVYGFCLVVGLGLLGLVLFAEAHRRVLAAAALGVFAANALVLINLSTALETVTGNIYGGGQTSGSLATGFYLACVALLLLVAAVLVAALGGVPREVPDVEGAAVGEPMDLTVTSLGSDIG